MSLLWSPARSCPSSFRPKIDKAQSGAGWSADWLNVLQTLLTLMSKNFKAKLVQQIWQSAMMVLSSLGQLKKLKGFLANIITFSERREGERKNLFGSNSWVMQRTRSQSFNPFLSTSTVPDLLRSSICLYLNGRSRSALRKLKILLKKLFTW